MFDRLIKNINTLDLNDILFGIWKRGIIQDKIIELNTEGEPTSQLFELGEDSEGKTLGEYSPFTKDIKASKGQRTDHITLNDSGDFYDSFIVQATKEGFRVTANPIKDDTNLFTEFGIEILGLNELNTRILLEFVEPLFEKELEKRLLQ